MNDHTHYRLLSGASLPPAAQLVYCYLYWIWRAEKTAYVAFLPSACGRYRTFSFYVCRNQERTPTSREEKNMLERLQTAVSEDAAYFVRRAVVSLAS